MVILFIYRYLIELLESLVLVTNKRYIRVGYNMDIMRHSACLVVNPIPVYSYGFLFIYTTMGQASDSMAALT